jgi:hypothetical protein
MRRARVYRYFDSRGDVPAAVEVDYVRADVEPGPCVVYSPDLLRVYPSHPGYNID